MSNITKTYQISTNFPKSEKSKSQKLLRELIRLDKLHIGDVAAIRPHPIVQNSIGLLVKSKFRGGRVDNYWLLLDDGEFYTRVAKSGDLKRFDEELGWRGSVKCVDLLDSSSFPELEPDSIAEWHHTTQFEVAAESKGFEVCTSDIVGYHSATGPYTVLYGRVSTDDGEKLMQVDLWHTPGDPSALTEHITLPEDMPTEIISDAVFRINNGTEIEETNVEPLFTDEDHIYLFNMAFPKGEKSKAQKMASYAIEKGLLEPGDSAVLYPHPTISNSIALLIHSSRDDAPAKWRWVFLDNKKFRVETAVNQNLHMFMDYAETKGCVARSKYAALENEDVIGLRPKGIEIASVHFQEALNFDSELEGATVSSDKLLVVAEDDTLGRADVFGRVKMADGNETLFYVRIDNTSTLSPIVSWGAVDAIPERLVGDVDALVDVPDERTMGYIVTMASLATTQEAYAGTATLSAPSLGSIYPTYIAPKTPWNPVAGMYVVVEGDDEPWILFGYNHSLGVMSLERDDGDAIQVKADVVSPFYLYH